MIIAAKSLQKDHSDLRASMLFVVAAKNKMLDQKLIMDCNFCVDL